MRVIVTMAGDSTRFKKAGIQKEKYKIEVRDKTMFEFAMESLEQFFSNEFIFITRESHNSRKFIKNKCDSLGIDNFIIEELSELSSGQAKTALAADEYINDDSDFVIYNIDTYIEPPELNPSIICGDGCIPAFRAQEDGWSYIDLNDNGNVSEVREKETFSNLASIGFYYFSSWLQYKALVEENEDEIIKEYGEVYVAPVFNYVINNGGKVTTHELDRDKCHIIGTPEELSRFESSSGI